MIQSHKNLPHNQQTSPRLSPLLPFPPLLLPQKKGEKRNTPPSNSLLSQIIRRKRSSPMSVPRIGNGTQACEACKYQRRKCAPDCILAPYFPHGRQRQFLNCHKLFGVSNITKIIRNLHPPDKDEAMRTIIFQSDVRASDPVGGCYRIIRDLQRQIEYTKAELDLVLHHLAICRATHQQQQASIPESPSSISISIDADPLSSYYHHQHHLLHPHPHNYLVQQQKQNQDINAWVMHDVDSFHVKEGGFVDVDDIKPLLDIHGDGDDGVDVNHRRFVRGVPLLQS